MFHTGYFLLKIDESILVSGYKDKLLKELKSPSKTSFKNIRQIIADSNIEDFEDVFRFLYDSLDEYVKDDGNKGIITIVIEEYMFHANFRIDKEINLMALISKILEIIQTKKVI